MSPKPNPNANPRGAAPAGRHDARPSRDARAAATLQDPRWAAVLARDRAADGRFCYAVTTTGVYCRPSCAARSPRPEHVVFHATAADAERAGFRACRRCRPDAAPIGERHAAAVARACRLIERSVQPPTLDELARHAGFSRYHLHRMFKLATGLTPKAYAQALRAQRLRRELAGSDTVTSAIYGAGYGSNGRFYAESDAVLGMTPTAWRSGGADTDIRYATGRCSLGSILVARSDRGVCAISFGDDAAPLVRELHRRFANARLIAGDADFEGWVARVIAFVEAPRIGLDLPLDVRGTAFQQRVWQALRDLAPGRTASYRDIAVRIGAPNAARAVAQACGANPLAVAIPCHRVVRDDGALSGYRWGVERKLRLLEREAEGVADGARPAGLRADAQPRAGGGATVPPRAGATLRPGANATSQPGAELRSNAKARATASPESTR